MSVQNIGTVGILPAGALGVAFFSHLTGFGTRSLDRVFFLERKGSESCRSLRSHGKLRLAGPDGILEVGGADLFRPDLLESAKLGSLPEFILVCTQPDQLLGVITSAVELLERAADSQSLEVAIAQWPVLILSSNGIYFQRVRQFLIEKLEEGTLFGRLPDLWPDAMPRIVGKLVRGVTIQTGQREGSGPGALYRPGPSGRTRLAGGDAAVRQRCAEVLTELGGWFEVAGQDTPTRVEFDKALVNLTVNLLGQLAAIDEEGSFQPLTIQDILECELPGARELARHVIEVGRAVHAYRKDEEFEPLWQEMMASCREHLGHVPSSLQWIQMELSRGRLQPHLTPTETWLLEPLIRYARAAGLEESANYFEALVRRVEAKLSLAIAAGAKKKGEPSQVRPS